MTQHEDYLQSIIDTIRESLLILDPNLKVVSANKTFYETFRVRPEETENKMLYKLGNGQWNISKLRTLLEELLPTHNPFNDFKVEHTFPKIGRRVMLLNARQIKEKGAWQNRILMAIEDITKYEKDKKEKDAGIIREREITRDLKTNKVRLLKNILKLQNTEDALRKSEERYKNIFENIKVSVWEEDFTLVKKELDILKEKGTKDYNLYFQQNPKILRRLITAVKIIDINPETIKMFEAENKSQMLKSLGKLFSPETYNFFAQELVALANGQTLFEGETSLRTLKNNSLEVMLSVVFPKPHENFDRVLVSLINISERKMLEKQKDEFLGIASHELKTPVTSIKAYGQVLQMMFQKKGDTKAVQALQKMDAQINKLTDLISDLLDVTKIHSGRIVFNKDYIDFNKVVKEVVSEMQLTTTKHKIVIKLDSSKSIYGDKERIGQVMTNLISNAIKYSPHTRKIIVSTKSDRDKITLCVRDFGVGIPEDKKGKVFEQFFRVSGQNHNTVPGLGLGLFISSEIIKRQGGRIWVESVEGKGSNFCFTLPVSKKKFKKS